MLSAFFSIGSAKLCESINITLRREEHLRVKQGGPRKITLSPFPEGGCLSNCLLLRQAQICYMSLIKVDYFMA